MFLMDRRGLITRDRETIADYQRPFAQACAPVSDLLTAIETVRPTALVGLSTVGGAFDRRVVAAMARLNERPMIFPFSNPTSHSECSAEDA
jgi:malate dehydrogenase (oxaloacetate-decarboxylating)(NADP+)